MARPDLLEQYPGRLGTSSTASSILLDPLSEQLIFDGLARLMRGRTSITIAHRLATVRQADVIFVLHGGVVSERGTHDELVAANGLYARLYRTQFRRPEKTMQPIAV